MEIEYSLSETDLIALAEYQAGNSPVVHQRLKSRRFAYLIGFFVMALAAYLISMPTIFAISFAALGVLCFALYPTYSKWSMRKNIPRIVHGRMRPSSIGKRRLRVTSDGLEQISDAGESGAKWGVIDNIIENGAHAFVSIEGDLAVIIPRFRIDRGSYETFVMALRQHLEVPSTSAERPHARVA